MKQMAEILKSLLLFNLCLSISIPLLFIGAGASSCTCPFHDAPLSKKVQVQGPVLVVMDVWYRDESGAYHGIHDVPVQGTVGDLARNLLQHIDDRPLHQAVMSYKEYPIEPESVLPLSDAGIGPETVVDVGWRLKSDIELLFEMLSAF